MILAGELAGAYLLGVVSVFVAAVLLGPKLTRWYMRKKLGGLMDLTGSTITATGTNVQSVTGVSITKKP